MRLLVILCFSLTLVESLSFRELGIIEGEWNWRKIKQSTHWFNPFGSSCSIESMSREWSFRRMQWPLQWTLRISWRNSLCIFLSRRLSMLQRIREECRRNVRQTQRLSIQPNGQTLKFCLVKLSGISTWAFFMIPVVSNKWREHSNLKLFLYHHSQTKLQNIFFSFRSPFKF